MLIFNSLGMEETGTATNLSRRFFFIPEHLFSSPYASDFDKAAKLYHDEIPMWPAASLAA